MRRMMVVCAAAALFAASSGSDVAIARGGGGGHGGGGHGGGGHGGGMGHGGGFGFGGGRVAGFAMAHPAVVFGHGFHGRPFVRNRFAFFGGGYYPYGYSGCYTRVLTPWGWVWRNACY